MVIGREEGVGKVKRNYVYIMIMIRVSLFGEIKKIPGVVTYSYIYI